MKKLLIIRHGSYDRRTGLLDDWGRDTLGLLLKHLKPLLDGHNMELLTSNAQRALDSSQVLTEALGCVASPHSFLWTGPDSPCGMKIDSKALLEKVAASRADAVMIMTHLEYSEEFPNLFGQSVLGVNTFPQKYTDKAEAWLIDCELKTCRKLTARGLQ